MSFQKQLPYNFISNILLFSMNVLIGIIKSEDVLFKADEKRAFNEAIDLVDEHNEKPEA